MFSDLGALSPLDGRYYKSVKGLSTYFSEAALMQYRVYVEVEYLIALTKQKEIKKYIHIEDKEQNELRRIYQSFDLNAAKEIKEIEKKTNHDVKAVEYYIQNRTRNSLHPWIHFALTSEDVTNISYSLMWKHALEEVYLPLVSSLQKKLLGLSRPFGT